MKQVSIEWALGKPAEQFVPDPVCAHCRRAGCSGNYPECPKVCRRCKHPECTDPHCEVDPAMLQTMDFPQSKYWCFNGASGNGTSSNNVEFIRCENVRESPDSLYCEQCNLYRKRHGRLPGKRQLLKEGCCA